MPDTSVNFAAPPETLTSDGRLAELAQILVSAVDRANPKKLSRFLRTAETVHSGASGRSFRRHPAT